MIISKEMLEKLYEICEEFDMNMTIKVDEDDIENYIELVGRQTNVSVRLKIDPFDKDEVDGIGFYVQFEDSVRYNILDNEKIRKVIFTITKLFKNSAQKVKSQTPVSA